MSILQSILETMYVDPEILEELSAEQKEVLFHKIREEQVRRWKTRIAEEAAAGALSRAPRLKWAPQVEIWDDKEDDKKAKEAAKRLKKLEQEREKEEMKEDQTQAKILAELQAQEELMRQQAEAERRAKELREAEEREKARMAEEEEKERLAAIEREQYLTLKEARLAAEREAKARKQREEEARRFEEERKKAEKQLEAERKRAEAEAKKMAAAKEKEIYMSLREIREKAKKQREMEEKRMDEIFKEQERMAKEAEAQKKAMVEKARREAASMALERAGQAIAQAQERRASVSSAANTLPSGGGSLRRTVQGATSAGNPSSRPSRPPNDEAVISWFQTEEIPRGVGRDLAGRWEPWLHGIISRQDAEKLLQGKELGAFLIRVSSRIWGYTLSFVDSDRMKHFLVDATDGQYLVFGAQTSRTHPDLSSLIRFHQRIPVSKTGTKLTNPVGDKRGNESLKPLVM